MTNLTNLLKLNLQSLVLWLFLIHAAFLHAADLTFTPATPLVEINKTITLSVQGAVGMVTWITGDGTIPG